LLRERGLEPLSGSHALLRAPLDLSERAGERRDLR